MPVRNAEKFLIEALDSIRLQSFDDWELIAVEDHSSDRSDEILERYAQKDSRIRWFENPGKGIIQALHHAFLNSTGELITRMDADDLMPKDKLADFVESYSGDVKEIITGKASYFGRDKISEGYIRYEEWLNDRVDQNDYFDHIYRECVIASPNWLVNRKVFEEIIPLDQLTYPEDYDMVLKWYREGFTIKGLDRLTHLWREHPDRTSRNSPHYDQEAFFKLKTAHFIANELGSDEIVQVIGKGRKADLVIDILKERNVNFNQYTFEGEPHSLDELNPLQKSILTAWPTDKKQQKEISEFLAAKGFKFGTNCWIF